MQIERIAAPSPTTDPLDRNELAEGLMLVRASNLKLIRLQLALERHDRRVALEAVDDLVEIDRSLQQYLASVPPDHGLAMMGQALEAERATLNHEKLSLAAEIISKDTPRVAPEPEPTESSETVDQLTDEAPMTVDAAADEVADDGSSAMEWPTDIYVDPEPPSRIGWWLAGLAVLLLVAAGAAVLLGALPGLEWLRATLESAGIAVPF